MMLICCFLRSFTYILALLQNTQASSLLTDRSVWGINPWSIWLSIHWSIDEWAYIPCSSLVTSFDISARMQGCGTPLKKLRIVPAKKTKTKQNNQWSNGVVSSRLNHSYIKWVKVLCKVTHEPLDLLSHSLIIKSSAAWSNWNN